jgi:hypothetical protein
MVGGVPPYVMLPLLAVITRAAVLSVTVPLT